MKYYKIFFLVILSVLLPLALFAQTPPINHVGYLTGVTGIIIAVRNLVEILTMIVVGLAILVFFWGLVIYIKNAGDPSEASKGKSIMIGGVIAIFVMASIWGIVTFIGNQFLISRDAAPATNSIIPSFNP